MYIIINNQKYKINIMNTFFKRLKGLMFKKEPIKEVYLFPKCSSIHTYFMKQNIDICILDKKYKVLYIKENLPKRKIIIKKGYYTLEMPLNTVKNINLGQTLKIRNEKN